MKSLTKNLKYFSGLTFIFSIIFFYTLYSAIKVEDYKNIWIIAIIYGLVLFASGLFLGSKDATRRSRLDLGYQYHLVTFVIVNSVGIVSMLVIMGMNWKNVLNALLYLAFWGLGLLVHYYFSSKSIKGMDQSEIFD